jgi:hypothetical protein
MLRSRKKDVAPVRLKHPDDVLDEYALPGTTLPDDRGDLTPGEGDGRALKDVIVTEGLVKVFYTDDLFHVVPSPQYNSLSIRSAMM